MGGVAVDLGHERGVRPVEVDLEAVQERVDSRGRQAFAAAELQEAALQLAAGGPGVGPVQDDGPPQPGGAAAPGVGREHRIDRDQVEQPQALGLVDGAVDIALREALGQVEQGAGRGGHGDRTAGGGLGVREAPGPVDAQTGSPGPAADPGDRHVDGCACARPQPPQGRGARVAEDRPLAEGQRGGQPAPLAGDRSVADGEYLAVKGVQPARANAAFDRRPADPERQELTECDHSMLGGGQGGQLALRGVDVATSHSAGSAATPGGSPRETAGVDVSSSHGEAYASIPPSPLTRRRSRRTWRPPGRSTTTARAESRTLAPMAAGR